LYDKRISQEVFGEDLGEEFAGYVIFLKIFPYYLRINNSLLRFSEYLGVMISKVSL